MEVPIKKIFNCFQQTPHIVLLSLILITSFTSWPLNNISIAFSILYSLYLVRNTFKLQKQDFYLFMPSLLLLAYLVGFLWSDDSQNALKQIEKRSLLLILPVIFFVLKERFTKEDIKTILHLFVLICLVLSLICYTSAIINILENNSLQVVGQWERKYYYYSYLFFTKAVDLDPIYLSLIVNFSIVILFYKPWRHRWFNFAFLLNLILFNILISSKIGLIAMFAICILYLLIHLKNKYLSFVIIALFACVSYVVVSSSFLKERFFLSTEYNFEAEYSGEWNSISQRLAIWTCAVEAIDSIFPAGYGTGDGQNGLHKIYETKKYIRAIDDEYNAHNEYLYTMLDLGLPGLIILMAILIIPVILTFQHKKFVFLFFILLSVLFFAVEVVLNRRVGIFFFAFFYSLMATDLYVTRKNKLVQTS